jgi:uncharacterized protein YqeY
MNNIEIRIRECITEAIKAKDTIRLGNLRIILGEFQRCKTKTISEMESVKILRRLEKLENEVLVLGLGEPTSAFLNTVREFLPTQVSEDTLVIWLENNIDFSKLKNKFEAVGIAMKYFPQGSIDGGILKNIILNRF